MWGLAGVLIVDGGGWVHGTELGAAADERGVTWVVGTEIWPAADTPPLLRFQKWLGSLHSALLLSYCSMAVHFLLHGYLAKNTHADGTVPYSKK